MKKIAQWIGVLFGALGTVLGISWAKRRLEARGAKRQRRRQEQAAAEVNKKLKESDEAIDRETEADIERIETEASEAEREAEERIAKGDPAFEEIQRMIEESKE